MRLEYKLRLLAHLCCINQHVSGSTAHLPVLKHSFSGDRVRLLLPSADESKGDGSSQMAPGRHMRADVGVLG